MPGEERYKIDYADKASSLSNHYASARHGKKLWAGKGEQLILPFAPLTPITCLVMVDRLSIRL